MSMGNATDSLAARGWGSFTIVDKGRSGLEGRVTVKSTATIAS